MKLGLSLTFWVTWLKNSFSSSLSLIAILAMLFPLEQLAKVTAGIALFVFSLVNLSLLLIKRRGEPAEEDVFTVPFPVPLVGFLVSMGFLAWELVKRI